MLQLAVDIDRPGPLPLDVGQQLDEGAGPGAGRLVEHEREALGVLPLQVAQEALAEEPLKLPRPLPPIHHPPRVGLGPREVGGVHRSGEFGEALGGGGG